MKRGRCGTPIECDEWVSGIYCVFSEFVNLRAVPYNFDNKPKGHSAQFRSAIRKRWVYRSKFLDDCGRLYNQ